MKILFLLKQSNLYGDVTSTTSKSGLLNSAVITARQLEKRRGICTSVRICRDANGIDKEVRDYRPDLCIIEAIWVLPSKFEELRKIYPHLPFIVRVHSEIPFLAQEGEAIKRIHEYQDVSNVYTAFNSYVTYRNFSGLDNSLYLPNIYEVFEKQHISFKEHWNYILHPKYFVPEKPIYNIGCFGAIRPMKNQLLQAFAAIAFGDKNNVSIRFNINSSRMEQGGQSVLKNIKALFDAHPEHELVEHEWMKRHKFLETINLMDLGMQVSFNESFNIVTADFVKMGVPTIVSPEITWMPQEVHVWSDDIMEIAAKMEHVLANKEHINKLSNNALVKYDRGAIKVWDKLYL